MGNFFIIIFMVVYFYDVQQKKIIVEFVVNGVKYVVWFNDGFYVVFFSKYNVIIVIKIFEQVSMFYEMICIKSVIWDDVGVLLYFIFNYVKYMLLNGDNGIVCIFDQIVYFVRVKGCNVYCLDCVVKFRIFQIDFIEYCFKFVFVKRNYEEMLYIIQNFSLVG